MNESQKYIPEFPADFKPSARNHPAYSQWGMMRSRCKNKRVKKYSSYGGRGISVCKRWDVGEDGMSGFECFMLDMGNKPTKRHSLDRIDNNGNYEPGNCRWATNTEQCNNRRSNRVLEHNGESLSMMEMARKHGISYHMLRGRISRGWSVEESLIEKSKPGWKKNKDCAAKGDQLPQSKLTAEKVAKLRIEYASGAADMQQIARSLGVSVSAVCMAINRKTWAHVP